ncbi:hypothetical protein KXX06_002725, partial [Aspergillus fumigatus]
GTTHPEDLEHVAVRFITAKFITSTIKAKDKLLWDGGRPQRYCVHGIAQVYLLMLPARSLGCL